MERVQFTTGMASQLRALRATAGYSQYDLAGLVKAPRASIKRWECEEVKTIARDVLARIEKALGARLDTQPKPPKKKEAPKQSGKASPKEVRRITGTFASSRKGTKVDYYRVSFAKPTPTDSLYGLIVSVISPAGTRMVTGRVCGLSTTASVLPAGELVMLGVLPTDV
jgi:transcriptional regulator with XRE-family HTH domain